MELKAAESLAIELMNQHGIINDGWYFEFDSAKKRFGSCNYRDKKITLSKPLTELNDEARVKNTILHEIAHALCIGEGHNKIWKAKAKEIGCDGSRCFSSKEVATPESKYIATCSGCNHEHKRDRITKGIRYSCQYCDSKFNTNFLLNFSINN